MMLPEDPEHGGVWTVKRHRGSHGRKWRQQSGQRQTDVWTCGHGDGRGNMEESERILGGKKKKEWSGEERRVVDTQKRLGTGKGKVGDREGVRKDSEICDEETSKGAGYRDQQDSCVSREDI